MTGRIRRSPRSRLQETALELRHLSGGYFFSIHLDSIPHEMRHLLTTHIVMNDDVGSISWEA
jgi:hypothetical protein